MQAIVRAPKIWKGVDEGNPNGRLLPPDYQHLTLDGKKMARLNACCLQAHLTGDPNLEVESWQFFRRYYLSHEDANFYSDPVESPLLHDEWIRLAAKHRALMLAAPRGFSKSTIMSTERPLWKFLTHTSMRIIGILSKDDFVVDRISLFKTQLEDNPRIIEDFGNLKPPRGKKVWNQRHLAGLNESHMIFGSIEGKWRGGRAHEIYGDDIEHDPSKSTDRRKLTAEFNLKMTRIFLPMMKKHSRIYVIGTLVERDTFLYHILTTKDDPRFHNDQWGRYAYAAINKDGSSLWPEAFPKDFLEQQERVMGASAFRAEFMNDPGSPEETLFELDEKTLYHVSDFSSPPDKPFETKQLLRLHEVAEHGKPGVDRRVEERVLPYNEVVDDMYRFITVDYAPTTTAESDYSCIHVMGLDKRNDLWSLDLWLDKKTDDRLSDMVWKYAVKWRVRMVGIEAVSFQMSFVNKVIARREEILKEGMVLPSVRPIKYPGREAKERRIAGLEWRFNGGKIKLPASFRNVWPYSELFYQIQNFSPDVRSLKHDDAIDTIAMAQYVTHGKRYAGTAAPTRQTVVEKLEDGLLVDRDTGLPLATFCDPAALPAHLIMQIMNRGREQAEIPQHPRPAHHGLVPLDWEAETFEAEPWP